MRLGGPLAALGLLAVVVTGAVLDAPDDRIVPVAAGSVATTVATTAVPVPVTASTPPTTASAPVTTIGEVDEAGEGDAVVADDRSWVWHQLALCESGQRWGVVRDQYQGGLQFDARTWDRYVVEHPGFPADADDASPEQQIAVAEDVLASEGVDAWPTCGPRVLLHVYTEGARRMQG